MSPYTMPSAPILNAAKLPRGACDRALTCFAGISATALCRFAPFETRQADTNTYYTQVCALIYLKA